MKWHDEQRGQAPGHAGQETVTQEVLALRREQVTTSTRLRDGEGRRRCPILVQVAEAAQMGYATELPGMKRHN
jgi:hypothetical protein